MLGPDAGVGGGEARGGRPIMLFGFFALLFLWLSILRSQLGEAASRMVASRP